MSTPLRCHCAFSYYNKRERSCRQSGELFCFQRSEKKKTRKKSNLNPAYADNKCCNVTRLNALQKMIASDCAPQIRTWDGLMPSNATAPNKKWAGTTACGTGNYPSRRKNSHRPPVKRRARETQPPSHHTRHGGVQSNSLAAQYGFKNTAQTTTARVNTYCSMPWYSTKP